MEEQTVRKQRTKDKKDKLIDEHKVKANEILEKQQQLKQILVERDRAIVMDEEAVKQVDLACVRLFVALVVLCPVEHGNDYMIAAGR